MNPPCRSSRHSVEISILVASIVIHRFRCSSALLQTPYQPLSLLQLCFPGAMNPPCRSSRHSVEISILVASIVIHRFRCSSALLQTPYHGKHGARSAHRYCCENCKHLAHYPAACAEPAKAGEEATTVRSQ
ncbi:hypothetical protein UY3_13164 [Chelonia mydas]|uniref:Uncharacterized protein n=1 Tax=Chelonia mydas TaxID=8469 RepID=M7AW48_CHEMY|nr:hypothetical protein UY3_13164 [Chelonia mydas]